MDPHIAAETSATNQPVHGRERFEMVNEYSPKWFEAFLQEVPDDVTELEVDAVAQRLPLPAFKAVLDLGCGIGRHTAPLSARGYEVTGIDRDEMVLEEARRRAPGATIHRLDLQNVACLNRRFDGALSLWQSIGYFDSATNDAVVEAVASLLRPGGRLLVDVYHPGHFATPLCRNAPRADVQRSESRMDGGRLRSRIVYEDGSLDEMDFEVFEPAALAEKFESFGLETLEMCCWWDRRRAPTPSEPRYQATFERV